VLSFDGFWAAKVERSEQHTTYIPTYRHTYIRILMHNKLCATTSSSSSSREVTLEYESV
jgi:hypothetical protein